MVVISPSIENSLIFEGIEWRQLLTANKKRSSEIVVSLDHKYLKKTKRRKGIKRDTEYYNLAFWESLLSMYHNETGSKIYVPTPYISEGRDIIMGYAYGTDLDTLLKSGSAGQGELFQIFELLGKLFKIKENEGLVHRDFNLRHLIVEDGLYVVDLENAHFGNGASRVENNQLLEQIGRIHKKDGIEDALHAGQQSIPAISLGGKALESVVAVYGERAKYYLKRDYNGQR